MDFKGSTQKYIRGENNCYDDVRSKLKTKPNKLSDIDNIIHPTQEIYRVLRKYYKRKGIK